MFCWLARLGKILTFEMLRRRNHYIVNGCPMSLSDEETVNPLLIHCQFAWRVWNKVFARFGLLWVMPKIVSELFIQWRINNATKLRNIFSKLSLCAGSWKIWMEKQSHISK